MELTTAQIGFLESSIGNFDISKWTIELAGQAASTRRFFRVLSPNKIESYILVEWDGNDEDWPRFFDINTHVSPTVNFLPKIYANDPAAGFILVEDLGTVTLKRFCGNKDNCGDDNHQYQHIEDMYRQTIDALCAWQCVDVTNCSAITSRAMDNAMFLWESDYFARYCVSGFFGKGELLLSSWEKERYIMAGFAASIPRTNIHRDFQSENILICNGRIRFVDYQGARLGPPYYDIASLLFDPYITQLRDESIDRLFDYYLVKQGLTSESKSAKNNYYHCAAQRLMQASGAYANLYLNKGKSQYRQYIPTAITRLSYILDNHLPGYPAMGEIVRLLI